MDENRIKQRLIGAIVLVSLAVIFIPMILSGGRDQNMPLFGSPVPSKPDNIANIKVLEFENVPKPPEPPSVVRTPVDKYSKADDKPVEAPVEESAKQAEKPEVKQTARKDQPLKAWVVQVGSFSNSSNAVNLKNKLVKKGFRAFVERVIQNNKTTFRVRVGPEIRRESAMKLQKEIEQKMNIKGLVVTHP